MRHFALPSLLIAATCTLSACAWVQLTDYGRKVRVLDASEVASCKKLGETTASVVGKVGALARHPETVEAELEVVGRNGAVDLGGDTIVPKTAVVDGKRTFTIYRCMGAMPQ